MRSLIPPVHAQGSASDVLDSVNANLGLSSQLTTPAGFITALLPNVLIVSGLVLFIMIIISGIQYMTAVSNPDTAEAAKKRLTMAVVGFFIVFAAYWLAQALQIIFGVPIVGIEANTPGPFMQGGR